MAAQTSAVSRGTVPSSRRSAMIRARTGKAVTLIAVPMNRMNASRGIAAVPNAS
ncbi:MAG: hypothetical protein H0W18_11220 [Acidobacteria bacterium]|nr:hypothetical protein [Acidobacteriota bacterium]